MRLIFGLLLLGGGALAALAVAWMFYSTSEPNVSTAQTDVSQTSAAPENTDSLEPNRYSQVQKIICHRRRLRTSAQTSP